MAKPSKRRKPSVSDTAQDNEATRADKTTPQLVATSKERNQNMSEAPSILTFSEDISSAEPPVPLPVGDYPAEIRGAVVKTSQKGNQYVSVTFFVAPEHYPADFTDGNADGELLTYNRLQYDDSPRGRHRMRKFTDAIGAKNKGNEIDINDWVGSTAILAVAEEEWEGEPRAVIAKITAA
jgi:hypothetical protein